MTDFKNALPYRRLTWLTALLVFCGCSLINTFESVPEDDVANLGGSGGMIAGGDGDGDGDIHVAGAGTGDGDGDGDGSGGRSTSAGGQGSGGTGVGGSGAGGSGGEAVGTGGEGTGGEGTGGSNEPGDPSLVVLLSPDSSLFAVSPQTGEILFDSGDTDVYQFAAHEAKRDVWFLHRGGRIVAGTFNRNTRKWKFFEEGPETDGISNPQYVFALPDRLVTAETPAGSTKTMLRIYDTSELDAIAAVPGGEFAYPGGTVWSVAALAKGTGGDVTIMTKDCRANDEALTICSVNLHTYAIQRDNQALRNEKEIFILDQEGKQNERGALGVDVLNENLVALIPSKVGFPGSTYLHVFSSTLSPIDDMGYEVPNKPGNLLIYNTLTVDPCSTVAWFMQLNTDALIGVPLVFDDKTVIYNRQSRSTGQGLIFEPYTRSLLERQDGNNYSLDAWSIIGTDLEPDLRLRVTDWTKPDVVPSYGFAATSAQPICP